MERSSLSSFDEREVSESLNVGHIPNFFEIGDEMVLDGSFGVTYSGKEISSKEEVVIKEVKKLLLRPIDLKSIHREISCLTECSQHPGILNIKCWFEEPTFFYIVTEKPKGGRLLDGLCNQGHKYGEGLIRTVIKSLLTTIEFLQEKNIVSVTISLHLSLSLSRTIPHILSHFIVNTSI
jgi:serine/threonine protein kinase